MTAYESLTGKETKEVDLADPPTQSEINRLLDCIKPDVEKIVAIGESSGIAIAIFEPDMQWQTAFRANGWDGHSAVFEMSEN